jgi:hypothetical protein
VFYLGFWGAPQSSQSPQAPSRPSAKLPNGTRPGRGAAWLARLTGGQEVGGSNPPGPTDKTAGRSGLPPDQPFHRCVARVSYPRLGTQGLDASDQLGPQRWGLEACLDAQAFSPPMTSSMPSTQLAPSGEANSAPRQAVPVNLLLILNMPTPPLHGILTGEGLVRADYLSPHQCFAYRTESGEPGRRLSFYWDRGTGERIMSVGWLRLLALYARVAFR